ncbi:hypothetical protein INT45_002303 [Circinella minor]|uniref:Uncharacterized protein n=1 Tax=Circinella minor TaxID=1195481 RepID=A0A8H7VSY4_9FUNG|nr:hypothetical protein INT45_002303 [Circinella minor]
MNEVTFTCLAEQEYKLAVVVASSSNDHLFVNWANNLIKKGFYVLNNIDLKTYWSGLLAHQVRQQKLDEYEMRLLRSSTEPSSSSAPVVVPVLSQASTPATASKLSSSSSSPVPVPVAGAKRAQQQHIQQPRQRIDFEEFDDCFIQGLGLSIGTFIGLQARNAKQLPDRKSQYFISIGMNGVIDLTDKSNGSQLQEIVQQMNDDKGEQISPYDATTIKTLIEQFGSHVKVSPIDSVTKYESILKSKILNYENVDDHKQLKKWFHAIKNSQIRKDKYERYLDSYIHIIKLHLYSSFLFNDGMDLSEQDFVVKIWSGLVENTFRGTGINPHWGDTIPSVVLNSGVTMKLDLRLLNSLDKDTPDYACGEFAKEVFSSKYYKDKLKAVLAAKAHMNQYFACNNISLERAQDFKYPFLLITGFEICSYYIQLIGPGLYILNSVNQAWFPTTIKEIKEGAIGNIIRLLGCFNDMCLRVKSFHHEKGETHKIKRRKSMSDLTNNTETSVKLTTPSDATSSTDIPNQTVTAVQWTRKLWTPK